MTTACRFVLRYIYGKYIDIVFKISKNFFFWRNYHQHILAYKPNHRTRVFVLKNREKYSFFLRENSFTLRVRLYM